MRIFNLKKFLVVSFVLFFLVNCVQDEMKEYVNKVTWKDINVEVTVRTKYFDNKINLVISVFDIDGISIFETEYIQKLDKADFGLNFMDKDSFLIFEQNVKIRDFFRNSKKGGADGLVLQISKEIDKQLYSRISKVKIAY